MENLITVSKGGKEVRKTITNFLIGHILNSWCFLHKSAVDELDKGKDDTERIFITPIRGDWYFLASICTEKCNFVSTDMPAKTYFIKVE